MTACCATVGGRLPPDQLDALNADLRARVPIRKVAAKYQLPHAAVQRHREHMPDPPIRPDEDVSHEPTEVVIHRDTAADAAYVARTVELVSTGASVYAVPNPGDDEKTAPRKVITALVERRCVELRAAGRPYSEIATEVGVSEDNAVDVVERVLLRTAKGTDARADAARALDVERIDTLLKSLWDRATSKAESVGDDGGYSPSQDKAVERVTKLLERRARLLGLDAETGPAVQMNVLNVAASPLMEGLMGVVLGALGRWPDARAAVVEAVRVEVESRRLKR